jgi:hypothetical protein
MRRSRETERHASDALRHGVSTSAQKRQAKKRANGAAAHQEFEGFASMHVKERLLVFPPNASAPAFSETANLKDEPDCWHRRGLAMAIKVYLIVLCSCLAAGYLHVGDCYHYEPLRIVWEISCTGAVELPFQNAQHLTAHLCLDAFRPDHASWTSFI